MCTAVGIEKYHSLERWNVVRCVTPQIVTAAYRLCLPCGQPDNVVSTRLRALFAWWEPGA